MDRPLFYEFHPSSLKGLYHYLVTQRIGFLPILVAALLLYAHPHDPGQGLWCALGLALGLELILWGAYDLRRPGSAQTRWGRHLTARLDFWFPPLMFVIRYAFVALLLIVLWVTIHELGFPTTWWHHGLFILLVVALPTGRFMREIVGAGESTRGMELLSRFFFYFNIALFTVICVGTLSSVIIAQSEPYQTDPSPALVLLWLCAVLGLLSCAVLFIGDWRRLYWRPSPKAKKVVPVNKPAPAVPAEQRF